MRQQKLFQSTHVDHGDNDMDLFVSYDRGNLIKAKFPPGLSKSKQPTKVT